MDFTRQLNAQLEFIEASCKSYDEGNPKEAKRIATSLRVIFHQTQGSTSLLTHMRCNYIKIMSGIPKGPYPNQDWSPLVETNVNITFLDNYMSHIDTETMKILNPESLP